MATAPVRIERDDDDIVTLLLDDPDASVNTMTPAFSAAWSEAVRSVSAAGARGIIIASAKPTFFAGGNLALMAGVTEETVAPFAEQARETKRILRLLETSGIPVVAAIGGAALGGGLEIALAAHRRIAVRDPRPTIGLPEVTFGLLPGGGGLVRTVRMLGVQRALEELLWSGRSLAPAQAHELGLVDELVDEQSELLPAARRWILSAPEASQPWDRDGFRIPGPPVDVVAAPLTAQLARRTRGSNQPAPRAILAAAVESARVDIDTATEVETRYFLELLVGPVAKNMIHASFDTREVRRGAGRPDTGPSARIESVAVIGAGMMGAGLAYQAARSGLAVRLIDAVDGAAVRGRETARALADAEVAAGRMPAAERDALLDRIAVVFEDAQLRGVDLVIEAIVEDLAVKRELWARIEDLVPGALLATNTSSLPIAGIASALREPQRLIGMHFFSPVDRMQLLEIVRGGQTAEDVVARAFDAGRLLGKTPIIVRDVQGFFTSRIIGARMDEAFAMVGEGVPGISIERASLRAGYPVGMLQFMDEVTLTLPRRVRDAARAAAADRGEPWIEHPGAAVHERLLDEFDRPGRAAGRGFYEYEDGRRGGLWSGLAEHFPAVRDRPPIEDLSDRLLFSETLAALACLREGVISSAADGNVGTLLGLAFPAWTGGAIQLAAGHPGGPSAFTARARELADRYGDRFRPVDDLDRLLAS
jgi:3-hydroxyacyl-CoA dehydrogenase / enoyl-CoA hydratase / 3-hydroxybutyryl-CoA epimerase